jgi:hypothetical protein
LIRTAIEVNTYKIAWAIEKINKEFKSLKVAKKLDFYGVVDRK